MIKTNKTSIAIILLVAALTFVGIAVAVTVLTIPSGGIILAPASLAATPSSIDFGTINGGSTTPIIRNVQITNNGGQTTQPLNMTYTTTIGTVTWSGEGQTLGTSQTSTYTFTLTPSASAPSGPFNFNVVING